MEFPSMTLNRPIRPTQELASGSSKRPKLYHGSSGQNFRFRRENYTVGWIAALALEMAAAREMLDEIHEDGERRPGDNNAYILGSMTGHNCVVACLPAGIYATTSATVVASDMRYTFPNIQFWLMVGVGGGAPTDNADIRLGDVVVSIPTDRFSGVVQYDYGKTVSNGEFEYTGILNTPPTLLLTAINMIRADHSITGTSIAEIVFDMLQRHPEMTDQYSHIGQEQDILFEIEYEHRQGVATCDKCDRGRVRTRQSRTFPYPTIHYGTIASGNQVIKHAKTRDKFARELGVLCFEMEAAGLMNNFPCLAIRGICDYADSHKNKKWQGYAAATAAAYAKHLLSKVSPISVVSNTQGQSISNEPSSSQSQSESIEQWRELLSSLSFDQIHARHMTIKNAHLKTCKWILDHERYKEWLSPNKMEHHHGFLWIKGKPAAGKSTIMKYLLTKSTKSSTGAITISYFFNARGEDLEKSIIGMYRSLLYQLFDKMPHLQYILDSIDRATFNHVKTHGWSIEALRDLFQSAIEQLGQHYLLCFIDALDECEEDDIRDMLLFFEQLGNHAVVARRQFRVCFSSRHYPHISMEYNIELILEGQEGHDLDIANYIQTELKAGRGKAVDDIKSQLLSRSSGVFLWIVLVVQMLNKEYDRGNIHAIRKLLKKIPDGLHELLEDIIGRNGENTEQTVLCLQWILYARRPLTIAEVYFAIIAGLQPDGSFLAEWDPDDVTPETMKLFILNSSKGLAENIRSKTPTVQFIHESVRDFLLKENGMQKIRPHDSANFTGSSHERLKQCCLTYMALDLSEKMSTVSELPKASSSEAKDLRQRVAKRFPFLGYAVQNILYHADVAEQCAVEQASFIQKFPVRRWVYLNNIYEKYEVRRYTKNVSLLYVFADKVLCALIPRLAEQDVSSQGMEDQRYPTPIHAAMAHNDEVTTRPLLMVLLQHGSDSSLNVDKIDVPDRNGMSPLATAVKKGDEAIVKLLLARGADIEGKDRFNRTPLAWAVIEGHQTMIHLLLEKGANVEARYSGRTPLTSAIETGHAAIVNLLLEKGATIEAAVSGWTPLLLASENGHKAIVILLLERGANIEARYLGRTPLLLASENGNQTMINLLLERGADIETKNLIGQTPLLAATNKGNQAIVNLLLEKGADIEAVSASYETPLSLASAAGQKEMANILLQNGANIEAKDQFGDTPLIKALRRGHEAVVNLLLEKGANIEAESSPSNWTPLFWALDQGIQELVKLLLDRGANAESQDCLGQTPLSQASAYGHETIVRLLLERGAKADSQDCLGETQLSRASANGHEAVVDLLRDRLRS